MITSEERVELLEAIREVGLGSHAEAIVSSARLAIRLVPSESGDDECWLGGLPVMPSGMNWPRWKNRFQAFIAHVSLAHVAAHDREHVLPSSGRLLFFYDGEQETWGFDPADRGSWKVAYVESNESCTTRASPDEAATFPRVSVEPRAVLNIPAWESVAFEHLGIADSELDAYFALLEKVNGAGATVHKLLGYPDPVQNAMESECQLASNGIYCGDAIARTHPRAAELLPGSKDWRLLLQIDSEDDAAMMWGDVGRLYYWIRDSDLRQHRFDDTWFILQCC